MEEKINLEIEQMEEEEMDFFNEEFEEAVSKNDLSSFMPEDIVGVRKILWAILKNDEDIDFYKKEYIPALKEKYIKPVESEIAKLVEKQDALKGLVCDYMSKNSKKTLKYPDLATVSLLDSKDKIEYPENETELAEKMFKNGQTEFIRNKPNFDKKKINKYFKENKEVPFDDLIVVESGPSIRIGSKKG